jgi:hypothetical protein
MKPPKKHNPRGGWRLGPAPVTTVEFIRSAQRLRDVVQYLDRELGEGYAEAHPSMGAAASNGNGSNTNATNTGNGTGH